MDLAIAVGFIPSVGTGYFNSPNWDYYYYAATTFIPHEKWLIHIDLGRQPRKQLKSTPSALLSELAFNHETSNDQWMFLEATNGEIYTLIPFHSG